MPITEEEAKRRKALHPVLSSVDRNNNDPGGDGSNLFLFSRITWVGSSLLLYRFPLPPSVLALTAVAKLNPTLHAP